MKKEHIMDAMDYIDPALIAAADTPASRRGGKGWVRYGIIAACLCLAMIGTAAAVHYSGVRAEVLDDGTIWLSGGLAQHSYDRLSDELKALEGEANIQVFASWQEMEDFMGFDLMNNPLLEANPSPGGIILERGNYRAAGRYLLEISADQDRMYPWGKYCVNGFDITLKGHFFTDHIPEDLKEFYGEGWDQGLESSYFDDSCDAEYAVETYTAPSGLVAQIVTNSFSDSSCILQSAFSINGAAYTMSILCSHQLDEAHDVLIRVLDSFVLD